MQAMCDCRQFLEKLATHEKADAAVVFFDGSEKRVPMSVVSTMPEALSPGALEASSLFKLFVPRAADTVIPNTRALGMTKEDPLVVDGPCISFYAERPLVIRGCIIGILCLFSSKAKDSWTPSEVFDATSEEMKLAFQATHYRTPEVQGRMASYTSIASSWASAESS
eukprot:gb/GFBE01049202.1/.p1 GENE.gb/GFBE01049202.1/~~gb/GFBE01049202.1/.p1  ORF type:complete len:167 (+),score=31.17 gb/GFBE01049202.1/:1-501(+)